MKSLVNVYQLTKTFIILKKFEKTTCEIFLLEEILSLILIQEKQTYFLTYLLKKEKQEPTNRLPTGWRYSHWSLERFFKYHQSLIKTFTLEISGTRWTVMLWSMVTKIKKWSKYSYVYINRGITKSWTPFTEELDPKKLSLLIYSIYFLN